MPQPPRQRHLGLSTENPHQKWPNTDLSWKTGRPNTSVFRRTHINKKRYTKYTPTWHIQQTSNLKTILSKKKTHSSRYTGYSSFCDSPPD